MKLTEEIKKAITEEYNSWFEHQYGNKTKKERQALGAFYTPAEITIQMIEMCNFDSLKGQTIFDPTCGSGNLLMACLIAGAEPENLYGNELDYDMMMLCKQRFRDYCTKHNLPQVPEENIHQGDILDKRCMNFSKDYVWPIPENKPVELW